MFLIHDDQPETAIGEKQRRPCADDDSAITSGHAVPELTPVTLCDSGMPFSRRNAEPLADPAQ